MITKFLTTYTSWKPKDKIAIAVSGGGDSLALLCKALESIDADQITAITFDHGLRSESKDEALYVKTLCDQFGVSHVILAPHNDEIGKSSQNWARSVRYRHLLAYCEKEEIPYLLFAHHAEDQKETLYIRLLQGSHLYGMCGMQPVRTFGNVCIVRPLLTEKKATLLQYLQNKNIQWVRDPSNDNEKYLRVKIRKYFQKYPREPINIPHEKIYLWRMHMQAIIAKWLHQYAKQEASQIIVSKPALLAAPMELKLHIVRQLLDIMGKLVYSPPMQNIHDVLHAICEGKNSVLHHCMIYHHAEYIHIQHEYVQRRMLDMEFFYDGYGIFDGRFHIHFPKDQKIRVQPLGSCGHLPQNNIQELCAKGDEQKNRHILSLPVVFLSQSEYILPIIDRSHWCNRGVHVQKIKTLDNIK